jgi:hypothetical protein
MLKEDHSFEYRFIYNDDFTQGDWTRQGDTVICSSAEFTTARDTIKWAPKYRFNYGERLDKFRFSRSKLFPIVKEQTNKNGCHLKRQ